MKGLRVAVGEEGSGTKILVTQFLELNGVSEKNTQLLSIGNQQAADLLLGGEGSDPHENYAGAIGRIAIPPFQDHAVGLTLENTIQDLSLVFKIGGRRPQGSQA